MAQRKKNSVVASILFGPVLIFAASVALWENEGRFDFAKAARQATVIEAVGGVGSEETVAFTAELNTDIPIPGYYVTEFVGYHVVNRSAEIYSWQERREDDRTVYRKGWYSSVDNTHRNNGIRQTLSSGALYPSRYQLGPLEIDPQRIHFVDAYSSISSSGLTLVSADWTQGLRAEGGFFYKRLDGGSSPQIGDERISFSGIRNTSTASYFGLLSGGIGRGKQFEISQSFMSAIIQNDGILHHLVNGDRATALVTLRRSYQRLKWIVRGAGTAGIVLGFYVFFSSFVNLLYRIPFLGNLVQSGVFLISLVLGLSLALFIMLSSLLVHRPFLVALPVGLLIAAFLVFRRRQSQQVREQVRSNLKAQQAALAPESRAGQEDLSTRELAERTFSNLLMLAYADQGLSEQEKRYITDWGAKNDIDAARMDELMSAAEQGKSEPRATSRDDLVLLACLAMADGALSTRELSRLIAFGKRLGMSTREVRKVIIDVESGALSAG